MARKVNSITSEMVLAVAAVIAMAMAAGPEALAQRYALTTPSVNVMRSEPDYESPMETQCLMGTLVEIIGEDGIWRKISCPEPYTAWTNELMLKELTPEEAKAWLESDKYIFLPMYGHVMDSPSPRAGYVSDLVAGDLMGITLKNGRPLRRRGWLGVTLPSGQTGWVRKGDVAGFREWAGSRRATPENVMATAKKLLGSPYLWGGESPKGVDCSGLVRYCYFLNGILLPRNTSQQVRLGQDIPVRAADGSMDLSALLPGDLVFFGRENQVPPHKPAAPGEAPAPPRVNHVAIYLGKGLIIQSSQIVRISSLTDPAPTSVQGLPVVPDFYSRKPLCARRIISGQPITSSPWYFPL